MFDIKKEKYMHGIKNKSVKMYFYTQRGLGLFNEFRYVFMVIFGIYMMLKMSNPWIMLIMFLVTVPILIIAGWFQVHHMAKVMNFLDVEFASYWTRYGYELQEQNLDTLNKIKESLSNRD